MSWTDEEIDNLFQESANTQSFEYNNTYFSEVEAVLPVNKKGKDFLWMGTALLFIIALTTGYFVTNSNVDSLNGYGDQLASTELNKKKSDVKINDVADKSSSSNLKSTGNSSEAILTNSHSQKEATVSELNLIKNNLIKNNLINKADVASDIVKQSLTSNYPQSEFDKSIQQTITKRTNATNSNGVSSIGVNASLTSLELETLNGQIINNAFTQSERTTDELQGSDISELATKSANQLDQNLDRSLVSNVLPQLRRLPGKSAFYVELNGGISQSLIASSNAANTSFGGGFGVESHLGNFNLTTGLNFKLSDFNDLSYSGSGFKYGYGSSFRAGSVNYEKMYSIEMPISLGYNLGKHAINIGVRPSVVIGMKYQETSFQNGQLVRESETRGFTDDLKRFGVKPTIGYAYHMKKWTIGGTIGVQMTQSVHEEEMNLMNKRLPVDGQLYLRRTIRLR